MGPRTPQAGMGGRWERVKWPGDVSSHKCRGRSGGSGTRQPWLGRTCWEVVARPLRHHRKQGLPHLGEPAPSWASGESCPHQAIMGAEGSGDGRCAGWSAPEAWPGSPPDRGLRLWPSCEWAGKGLQISCPALSPATCAYLEDNVCRRCRAVASPGRTPPPHPLHSLSSTHWRHPAQAMPLPGFQNSM